MVGSCKSSVLSARLANDSKSTLRTQLKVDVDTSTWGHLASDREVKRSQIVFNVGEFENNRFVLTELKRAGRYMEDTNLPPERSTNKSLLCDQCGRV